MLKIRTFPDKNYKAVFINGKTIRLALDPDKPIQDLDYPEFMDVKITNKCFGHCPYCYQNSSNTGDEYGDILLKIRTYFSTLTDNQRPFQVAIGGGNPNEHPQFIEALKLFDRLGILPNYTTNGMGITPEVIEATKQYCGGVALSCHPHMDKYRQPAFRKLKASGVQTNLHIIISDKASIDRCIEIMKMYQADYFVLLPLVAKGKCKEAKIEYEYLISKLSEAHFAKRIMDKIAFGAMFYSYIKHDRRLDISIYEPEIMSKYLDLRGHGTLHSSSFNDDVLKDNLF